MTSTTASSPPVATPPPATGVLEAIALTKRYGAAVALDACSLRAVPGRLLGLLGPNGAGKTTLMRAVLGLVRPDAGAISWDGRPIDDDARRRVGYMPEERGLYPAMRVGEQVVHFARLSGLGHHEARVAAAVTLQRVGLADQGDRRVDQLSHGNQQRAQLAVALAHDPALLVLDEPFAGLDPLGVDHLGQVLQELARDGRTVVFSSHQLDLVEDLCEDVVILDAGRVVLSGALADLRAATRRRHVEVVLARDGAPAPVAWPVPEGAVVQQADGHGVRLLVDRDADLGPLLGAARGAGELVRFTFDAPSLEELFREAVGR